VKTLFRLNRRQLVLGGLALGAVSIADAYTVRGQSYQVLPSAEGFVEEGLASWYGEPFHGRQTANQEVYNMHQMTAAHKTLPLPTAALVTNLDNGLGVVVRINDRGPFIEPRVLDLSYGAACALEMDKCGVAPVRIVTLSRDFMW